MVGTGGRSGILGDAIALVMTLGFAANVVILRRHHEMSMAPAAALSQLIVVVAGAPFSRLASVGSHDLVFLVLIGAGSLGLGVIFLMRGSRLIPVTDVMIISLLEVVLGPLGVWLVFSQWPGVATLVGGVIVLAAVGLQILGRVHSASVGLGVEP
jgi:drug/metabolite transporter (DMT)-like permease